MAWQPATPLAHAVYAAGFAYDGRQDILYSRMYAPLQRNTGFCWAYDCASAAMLMIIDCETFYFPYDGKLWMIELWKGQYGLETGCEIGVYNTSAMAAGGSARGTFFNCALDSERPRMWLKLSRDGVPLLERGPELHWWLTGFKWGVFTRNTFQLSMDIRITFEGKPEMCTAFKGALREKGYPVREIGNTGVAFVFNRPVESQPASRAALEGGAQATNQCLVERYLELKDNRSSNDPNGFGVSAPWLDAPRRVVDTISGATKLHSQVGAAAKKFQTPAAAKFQNEAAAAAQRRHEHLTGAEKTRQELAAAAAKKIRPMVSSLVDRLTDQCTGDADTYGRITAFFEGMARRTTPFTRG